MISFVENDYIRYPVSVIIFGFIILMMIRQYVEIDHTAMETLKEVIPSEAWALIQEGRNIFLKFISKALIL
jgi:hypothetical protein